MWDLDPDEWFFLIIAILGGAALSVRYFTPLMMTWNLPIRRRFWLSVWPIACLVPIFIVLCTCADPHVRGHADYTTLFMVGGVVWTLAASAFLPIVGVRWRDDCLEGSDPAAAIVAASAMLASALCYAGANIGTGPTVWTTILPAGMATAALAGAALIVRLASPVADAVAIDRDIASAAVFGGFLVAAAIILAWAAAGDFVDWNATLGDFARRASWTAIPAAAAIAALWIIRPRVESEGTP
ncbi:MAG TPA: hypothetical protein VHY37_11910 [Tepidisphaeraceae bacterium]|jgi:putative intracellular protease/amidase|nr:hypothetical protein [Tepidisphaeraceae bacterium]